MLRRRVGVVIDEAYVQEHILTGGNVTPLEAPRELVNGRSAHFARRCRVAPGTPLQVWPFLSRF
jgi:hypothetical protein